MCGITGAIGVNNIDKDKILSSISHRGPDSQGSFLSDDIFLGHSRLSIQDLSDNGSQPMISSDGRYVIVFNGEIYNHVDIRNTIAADFAFKSTGDTETVLYAYIKYGINCLKLFNGIFAFAVYDTVERHVTIARDQLGVKPLYIYNDGNCFLFSSEIKTFLSFNINKELNYKALANYLTYLWSPGELTPFKYVKKLLPGHYLDFDIDKWEDALPVPFYQIPFDGKYSTLTEEQLIDQLDEKLVNAVKRQMLSDVPVGFFLSGGLDSSLLVAIARKHYPDISLPCFTIDTGDLNETEGFTDDLHYAKKVAEYLNVDLHIVEANIDIVKDFDKMIWHLDEPQADAAPLNVLNICTYARKHGIKVLIGGAAGDDLFSGYRRHQALGYEKYFKYIPWVVREAIRLTVNLLPAKRPIFRRLRKLTRNLGKSTEQRMAGYFSWLPDRDVKSLFSDRFRKELQNFSPLTYLANLSTDIPNEKDLLNRMLYWEMKTFMVDHNLNYTDKLSMAVGVEARVPYLDLEVVEFSTKIPPELKLKNNETKYILKKVAERYLPNEIIYRPKTGFGAPVRKWITFDLDDEVNEKLSEQQLIKRGIFDPKAVKTLIEKNKSGEIDASYIIWGLLAIESWMEQYNNYNNTLYDRK